MAWGEAWSLTRTLLADPSSHVAASVAGWEHPFGVEAQLLADLYDITLAAAAGKRKAKPYPRPWHKTKTRFGRAARPQAEIRAALAARGH